MKSKGTIVEIVWKNRPIESGERHEYYTCPSAIYSDNTDEEIGISKSNLNTTFFRLAHADKPLVIETQNAWIIKGEVKSNEVEKKKWNEERKGKLRDAFKNS